MRFLTVTLLGAVTLLGYTTIVLAGKIPPPKDVNELLDQYTIAPPCKKTCRTTRAPPPTSTRAPPPTSTPVPPPTSTVPPVRPKLR
uniref:Putative secreted protein n=1 Tax=Anopheles triannulatus TaxID=58253 RepID=A0A2M4B663_9DIPT